MEVELNIYWSSIEFSYGNNLKSKKKIKGGFVYCFVKAFDAREAIDKFESAIKSRNLKCIKIDYVLIYDENMEWETEQQTQCFIQLYNLAKRKTDVIFDVIYAYETD